MLYYERKLKKQGYDFIIGVDEAGRGPLAGPVVAAAVLYKKRRFLNRIDDSKKLTAAAREKAFSEITKNCEYAVGIVGHNDIDRINILAATCLAMEQALDCLAAKAALSRKDRVHIIVDGNLKLKTRYRLTAIIGGDAKSKTIAAASIVAKVTRDRIMGEYDKAYPQYKFLEHKGYPTEEHRKILKEVGPCPIHRKSFCFD